MNRTELATHVAAETGLSARDARAAVDSTFNTMTRSLAAGESVAVLGFGTLVPDVVPSRMVRNPQTGTKVRAKKAGRVKFRPSQSIKEIVAGRAKAPKVGASGKPSANKAPAAKTAPAKRATTAKKAASVKTPTRKATAKK